MPADDRAEDLAQNAGRLAHEARLFLKEERLDDATARCEAALRLNPTDAVTQLLGAEIAMSAHDYSAAVAHAETALRLRPNLARAAKLLPRARARHSAEVALRLARLRAIPQVTTLRLALSLREKATALAADSSRPAVAKSAVRAMQHASDVIAEARAGVAEQVASQGYALSLVDQRLAELEPALRAGAAGPDGRSAAAQRTKLLASLNDLQYVHDVDSSSALGGFTDLPLDCALRPAKGALGPVVVRAAAVYAAPPHWAQWGGLGAGGLLAVSVFLPLVDLDLVRPSLAGIGRLAADVPWFRVPAIVSYGWLLVLLAGIGAAIVALRCPRSVRIGVNAGIGLVPWVLGLYIVAVIGWMTVREHDASRTRHSPQAAPMQNDPISSEPQGLTRSNPEARETFGDVVRAALHQIRAGAWLLVLCPLTLLLIGIAELRQAMREGEREGTVRVCVAAVGANVLLVLCAHLTLTDLLKHAADQLQ